MILLSRSWAVPLIATMTPIRSNPSIISTDLSFSRADVVDPATGGDASSEFVL